jgi:hypothetical protein
MTETWVALPWMGWSFQAAKGLTGLDLYALLCEAVITADGGERCRTRTSAGHVTLRIARPLARTACVVIGLALLLDPTESPISGLLDRVAGLVALLVRLVRLHLHRGYPRSVRDLVRTRGAL